MHNEMKSKLLDLYEVELARKAVIQKELKSLPAGKLVIKQNREKYLLLYCSDGSQLEGITRNHRKSRQHARKCFLENQLDLCEINCSVMETALQSVRAAELNHKKLIRPGAAARLSQVFPDQEFQYSQAALDWMNAHRAGLGIGSFHPYS